MHHYDVYGVGNALVDSEYEVTDEFLDLSGLPKGVMTLIEEQQRQKLIQLLEDEHGYQVIKLAGGGSAANTIATVSQLGGNGFYSCKVANDQTGDFFVKDLKDLGIHTNLAENREPGVTGECISLVTPDAERTLASHLGITQSLSPENSFRMLCVIHKYSILRVTWSVLLPVLMQHWKPGPLPVKRVSTLL